MCAVLGCQDWPWCYMQCSGCQARSKWWQSLTACRLQNSKQGPAGWALSNCQGMAGTGVKQHRARIAPEELAVSAARRYRQCLRRKGHRQQLSSRALMQLGCFVPSLLRAQSPACLFAATAHVAGNILPNK